MLRYDNGPFGQFPGLPGFGMAGAPGCRVRLGRRRALRSVTVHRAAGAFFFFDLGIKALKKRMLCVQSVSGPWPKRSTPI